MAIDNNAAVHSRVISAFFDHSEAARKAVDDLIAAGIPREHITQSGGQGAATATSTIGEEKGMWESLKDLFLPEEDRYTYAEGLRRGGYLVSVRADEANYDRVIDILDTDGSVNLDERESQWRSEGWSGFQGAGAVAGTAAAAATARPVSAASTLASSTTTASSASIESNYQTDATARAAALGRPSTTATGSVDATREEVIPLYEEQLRVGKRDVSHGRVRLRSYVVETPVSEQVSLHDEKVFIDRKPVDRPIAATDALFQERVIEAEERTQEAVISKEARVREEVTLRKTSEDRVQNVTDTVRRTELEVDDKRSGVGAGGVAGFSAVTDAARIVEHMDVISSDGQKIGTVDHLDGPDRIKLAKSTSPDGQHHHVPMSWIDHVDTHVHLNKTLAAIRAQQ